MVTGNGIPYRPLGRTGVSVSMIGLGGAHLARPADERIATQVIREALAGGINFMDNAWCYGDGESELRMGRALRDGYRDKAFLMTKIQGRTKAVATRQLDECLRRLQTDHVDLLQIHEVLRQEDADWVFAPGGTIEALIAAREAGKTRFIGFTGHKDPSHHLKMLRVAAANGFRFDTVQMPLSVLDHLYEGHSFERQVLPLLVEQGIGVLAMKSMSGNGRIPATGVLSAPECLRYALNLPTSVVITGCESMTDLNQAFDVARTFAPLSAEELADMLARAATLGPDAVQPFKTTQNHDGSTHHPEWMWG